MTIQAMPEGVLRFAVDVDIDLNEMATWEPQLITRFFDGLAMMLTAKAYTDNRNRR